LEVLEEMQQAWISAKNLDLAAEGAEGKAGQLVFPGNTMKYFSNDHLKRGLDIFTQVIDAEEIKLEKFTKLDPYKGVTFERDQFQSVVQEKFLKPMRYWARTWKQIDFSQQVRFNKGNGDNPDWEYRTLAESMFGREMLNIPEFWHRVKPGTPGAQKYTTRSRNKGAEWEETWRIPGEIDGAEINNNRDQLVKQMAKVRIAAELYAHVDLHSNDPRYDFRFYETIYQALERIPGGIGGDESDLKSGRSVLDPNRRYFSKEDINWIRRKSNTSRGWLYTLAILTEILSGGWKGLQEAAKKAGSYVGEELK
jgi:hypothetical protein